MAVSLSQRDALLRLWVTPGIGPTLGRRLIEAFSSPEAILGASPDGLEQVRGIGTDRARAISKALHDSESALHAELISAERAGARLITLGEPEYPPLLAQTPDAPLVLLTKGDLPCDQEDYCIAIVGSRRCTPYGVEQAERFSTALAQSGLVIVSGGARGIDSAAHRAAARIGARTVAVLGCGLGHIYPPENRELFERIIDAGGAVISELPMNTAPAAENFPARNRIIAGLSLGVLVIEAPKGSGALITARLASESYGREVLAVPARIDSPASKGSNDLLKDGGAAMATDAQDVLSLLESAALHQFNGTHATRFGQDTGRSDVATGTLSEPQKAIVEALDEARSMNDLCRLTGLEASVVQAETTVLEIRRVIVRAGDGLIRRR